MDRLIRSKCLSTMKQILNPVDIYSAIKPLFYLSKILGLAPFKYSNSKSESRIQISTAGTIHSLLMSGLLVAFFIVVFRWDIENFYTHNCIIGIILISDSCFLSLSVIVSFALCATINRCKVMKFLSLVNKVDVWLIKSSNSYKKNFQSLCLVMTAHLVINLVCYFFGFRVPPHVGINDIRLLCFAFNFVSDISVFHFIFSVILLKGRVEILHEELLSVFDFLEEELTLDEQVIRTQCRKLRDTDTGLLHESTGQVPRHHITATQDLDSHASDSHFCDFAFSESSRQTVQVLKLRGIYNVLCDAAELIVAIYQVQFLMTMIQIFVETTGCLCGALKYFIKFLTCQLQNPSRWKNLNILLVCGTINLTKLVAITASCHGATQRANHTAVLLHRILLVRPLYPEVKAELQMFSQQLLHRKLQFSPCGMFALDLTLLFSLAGAVTTYLIVLLQHCGQGIDDFMLLCNTTFRETA